MEFVKDFREVIVGSENQTESLLVDGNGDGDSISIYIQLRKKALDLFSSQKDLAPASPHVQVSSSLYVILFPH